VRPRKQYTFEQFAAIRRYGAVPTLSFSPDGSQIAYTVNTSGQFNLWRQSTDGGFPHQLTTYTERTVRTVAWSPDGRWIAYNADHHGDEFHQLFIIPAQGGQPEQLTDAPNVQHHLSTQSWSPNGRNLAYSANDRDRTAMDVLVRDMKAGAVRRVLAGDANHFFGGWSPDNRRLVAVEVKSNTNTDVHLVDLRNGRSHPLTPHEGEVRYFPGSWAPDGSGFFLVTDEGREFMGVAFFDVRTERRAWVETPGWDVEDGGGSRDGRYAAWVVNQNGYSRLYVRNRKSGKLLDLPDLPRGVLAALTFSPDGDKLGLMEGTPTHCPEIFVIDLRRRTLTRLTHSMLGGIDEGDLARPKAIRFPTFDGRNIPGLLYKPKEARAAGKVPVILSISRWAAGAGASDVPLLRHLSVLGPSGHWGAGAQHPWLHGLRQDLSETHPPGLGRR
jgi:Tol biopolymer transport system component